MQTKCHIKNQCIKIHQEIRKHIFETTAVKAISKARLVSYLVNIVVVSCIFRLNNTLEKKKLKVCVLCILHFCFSCVSLQS